MQPARHIIPFGINRRGQLVTPTEVRRGLACACKCPSCKDNLIARQGEKVTWHFAHQSYDGGGDGHRYGCAEGVIHKAACEYLATATGRWLKLPTTKPTGPAALRIAGAQQEVRVPGTSKRVDVMITSDAVKRLADPGPGQPFRMQLAVEIYVTNPKDEEFAAEMAKVKQHCIEIHIPPDHVWQRVHKGATWTGAMRGLLLQSINGLRSWWIYPPLPTCQTCGADVLKGQLHCWGCNPDFDRCPTCGARKKKRFPQCFDCNQYYQTQP